MPSSKAIAGGLPTDLDIQTADQLRSVLASAPSDENGVRLRLLDPDNGSAEIILTHELAETFTNILRLISSGKGFPRNSLSSRVVHTTSCGLSKCVSSVLD